MEKYYYTKWVKPSETVPFEETVFLNIDLALGEKITFLIRPCEMQGALTDDNIEMQATEVLSSAELDQIAAAINSFDENHPLVIRNNIRINHVDANFSWCQNLIKVFGANNLVAGKEIADFDTLFVELDDVFKRLNAGAPELAYMRMLVKTPSSAFTQTEKDEFLKRFEVYLGKANSDYIKTSMGL